MLKIDLDVEVVLAIGNRTTVKDKSPVEAVPSGGVALSGGNRSAIKDKSSVEDVLSVGDRSSRCCSS